MLHLIGIIISFFLCILLITKKQKSKADIILSIWLFFISLHLTLFYIHITDQYIQFPYFLGFELPLPLIHGPFLYLYTNALTMQRNKRIYHLLHFLPVALAIILLHDFFILPFDKKIEVYVQDGAGFENVTRWVYFSTLVSGIIYVILSLMLLKKYATYISNNFSDLERINLNWLKYLILGVVVIWISVFFSNDFYIFTALDFYILFIGYFGIKQVGIFTNNAIKSEIKINTAVGIQTVEEKIKYQNSAVDQSVLLKIHQELQTLMQKEKLYKDPELKLDDLSQNLNVNPNILSQVINSLENKNYFDYVNGLRIEEFIRISAMPDNQKFTLLSLAFEVGFNSKTSFNRNFKKATGLTPSMYLKEKKIQLK